MSFLSNDNQVSAFLDWAKERYDFQCCSNNLLCQKCPRNVPVCFINHRFPKWCLSLSCSSSRCDRKWHTCFLCSEGAKMYRIERLQDHEKWHQQQLAQFEVDMTTQSNNDTSTTEYAPTTDDKLRSYCPDPNWATFFIHHQRGNALKYLVARQFSDDANPNHITKEDAELHVLIAAHCQNLTKGERTQFAEILRRIADKSERECEAMSSKAKIPEDTRIGNHRNGTKITLYYGVLGPLIMWKLLVHGHSGWWLRWVLQEFLVELWNFGHYGGFSFCNYGFHNIHSISSCLYTRMAQIQCGTPKYTPAHLWFISATNVNVRRILVNTIVSGAYSSVSLVQNDK